MNQQDDQERLAYIRMQQVKWESSRDYNAQIWDTAFLLKIIDELIAERKVRK